MLVTLNVLNKTIKEIGHIIANWLRFNHSRFIMI